MTVRTSTPWLLIATATVAAFIDGGGSSGSDTGFRVMLILLCAAIVAAVQAAASHVGKRKNRDDLGEDNRVTARVGIRD